jgi:hypothetical protein
MKTTNELLKFAYKLNAAQYLNVETMVVILIDKANNRTIEEALRYSNLLKEEHRVKGNLITRIEINTSDAEDMTIWQSYRRNSYAYKINDKESDLVRLLSNETFHKLALALNEFQNIIREGITKRIDYLNRQFK